MIILDMNKLMKEIYLGDICINNRYHKNARLVYDINLNWNFYLVGERSGMRFNNISLTNEILYDQNIEDFNRLLNACQALLAINVVNQ